MKRQIFFILILGFAELFASSPNLGGFSGWVERMGAGPREQALGNAGVADSSSDPAAFWNPALLPHRRQLHVSLHAENRALGRRGGSLGMGGSVGSRMGVGAGILYRSDSDFPLVDEDDLDFGSVQPWFMKGYVGLGWRFSRRSSIGASFTWIHEDFDIAELQSFTSPLFFDLGGYFQVFKHWQLGYNIRNLGFNSNLTARFNRLLDSQSRIAGEEDFLPRTVELGAVWSTLLANRPLQMNLTLLDYQLADSLFVFDRDLHAVRARMGTQWEFFPGAFLRGGYDAGSWSTGFGWIFHPVFGRKKRFLEIDWALTLERNAYFVNFLSLGTRFRF